MEVDPTLDPMTTRPRVGARARHAVDTLEDPITARPLARAFAYVIHNAEHLLATVGYVASGSTPPTEASVLDELQHGRLGDDEADDLLRSETQEAVERRLHDLTMRLEQSVTRALRALRPAVTRLLLRSNAKAGRHPIHTGGSTFSTAVEAIVTLANRLLLASPTWTRPAMIFQDAPWNENLDEPITERCKAFRDQLMSGGIGTSTFEHLEACRRLEFAALERGAETRHSPGSVRQQVLWVRWHRSAGGEHPGSPSASPTRDDPLDAAVKKDLIFKEKTYRVLRVIAAEAHSIHLRDIEMQTRYSKRTIRECILTLQQASFIERVGKRGGVGATKAGRDYLNQSRSVP